MGNMITHHYSSLYFAIHHVLLFCNVKFVIYISYEIPKVAVKCTILKKLININRTAFVVKFQNVAIENAINHV